jgi:hypothetical protein
MLDRIVTMLSILLVAITLYAMAAPDAPPPLSTTNRWAEPTRGILAQHCGRCHLPNLPTTVPRALAVFDLTEEPWHARLTNDQLDQLVPRISAVDALPDADKSIVESFVRCAREHDCPPIDSEPK